MAPLSCGRPHLRSYFSSTSSFWTVRHIFGLTSPLPPPFVASAWAYSASLSSSFHLLLSSPPSYFLFLLLNSPAFNWANVCSRTKLEVFGDPRLFLIGRTFLREPSWKYSPNCDEAIFGVQKASLNMFWEYSPYSTTIASDWLRAELSCGWRRNKKNGWRCR